MKLKFSAVAVAFSLFASGAQADMIVVNSRYVVAKDTIRGYFYRQNNKQTVFDVRWSDWSTQYRCDDDYDLTRVEAASLNLGLQIAEARSLNFKDFLESEGFVGCKKF